MALWWILSLLLLFCTCPSTSAFNILIDGHAVKSTSVQITAKTALLVLNSSDPIRLVLDSVSLEAENAIAEQIGNTKLWTQLIATNAMDCLGTNCTQIQLDSIKIILLFPSTATSYVLRFTVLPTPATENSLRFLFSSSLHSEAFPVPPSNADFLWTVYSVFGLLISCLLLGFCWTISMAVKRVAMKS
jgi:hypothetical protein